MESSARKRPPTSPACPTSSQKGTRVRNWLRREQAKELLTVPDRSKIKGKRDYAILALLVGCALRRQELASLDVDLQSQDLTLRRLKEKCEIRHLAQDLTGRIPGAAL